MDGKRVVELGCGLGLPGLTAAVTGAAVVTLCDREGFALHCAMSSASVNGIATGALDGATKASSSREGDATSRGVIRAAVDEWDTSDGDTRNEKTSRCPDVLGEGVADVVLASDVLYDVNHVEGLVKRARTLLGNDGGVFLVTDPENGRASGYREAFVDAVTTSGGTVEEDSLPQPQHPESWDMDLDGSLARVVLIRAEWPSGAS